MRQAAGIFNYFDICPWFSTLHPGSNCDTESRGVWNRKGFPVRRGSVGYPLRVHETRRNIISATVRTSLLPLSFLCSSETSAASGHSDCPTVISVDSNQSWSGIHSSTGTGISTERSSVFSWGYDVSVFQQMLILMWSDDASLALPVTHKSKLKLSPLAFLARHTNMLSCFQISIYSLTFTCSHLLANLRKTIERYCIVW